MGRHHRNVLFHGEVGKDLTALGDEPEPETRHAKGRPSVHALAIENDLTRPQRKDAHDRQDRGGLSHAVSAQERDNLSGIDVDTDVEQHLAYAISCIHVLHAQHARLARSAT